MFELHVDGNYITRIPAASFKLKEGIYFFYDVLGNPVGAVRKVKGIEIKNV